MYDEVFRIFLVLYIVMYTLLFNNIIKKEKTEKRNVLLVLVGTLIIANISAYLTMAYQFSVTINHIAYKMLSTIFVFVIPLWFLLLISFYNDKQTDKSKKIFVGRLRGVLLFAPCFLYLIVVFRIPMQNIYYSHVELFQLMHSNYPIFLLFLSIYYSMLSFFVIYKSVLYLKYITNANKNFLIFNILTAIFFLLASLEIIFQGGLLHFYSVSTLILIVLYILYYEIYNYDGTVNKEAILNIVMERMEQPFFVCNAKREIVSINESVKEIIPEFKYSRNYKAKVKDIYSLNPIASEMDKEFSTAQFTIFTDECVKYLEASISCVKVKGKVVGYGIVINDQTPITVALQKQRKLAEEDYLTGLYNRRTFMSKSQEILNQAIAETESYAIMMFDLDNFKKINDTYSHLAGDEVLVNFSNMLKSFTRVKMVCGRYGGEEFSMVITGYDEDYVHNFSNEINKAVRQLEIAFEKTKINITVSIGVCYVDSSSRVSFADAIKEADEALYQSKNSGKDKYTLIKV